MRLARNIEWMSATLVLAGQIVVAGDFDGLDMNLGNLARVSGAQSRSISPENFTGAKGKAGMATEGTGKDCARIWARAGRYRLP